MDTNTGTVKVDLPQRPPLTLKEYKKAMHDFFTVQRPTVLACGHKFKEPPQNHCEFCWFAYFNELGQTINEIDKCYKEDKRVLIALKGKTYTKMFTRFMSTVNKMIKEETNEIR